MPPAKGMFLGWDKAGWHIPKGTTWGLRKLQPSPNPRQTAQFGPVLLAANTKIKKFQLWSKNNAKKKLKKIKYALLAAPLHRFVFRPILQILLPSFFIWKMKTKCYWDTQRAPLLTE